MAMKERDAVSMSGWVALLLGLVALGATIIPLAQLPKHQLDPAPYALAAVGLFIAGIILLVGCLVIGPNEARVLTFFGRYTGTVRTSGLRWVNPFTNKRNVSLRARNFESAKIKVMPLRRVSPRNNARFSTASWRSIRRNRICPVRSKRWSAK